MCLQIADYMGLNSQPLYAVYLILVSISVSLVTLYYMALRFIKQKSRQDW